jgi:hypothetical protein
MQRYKTAGLSLPIDLLRRIDTERGDVSRSRFLLRLIERRYREEQEKAEE